MITFDKLWQLLADHGSSDRRRAEASELFERLSAAEQQQLYEAIESKLRQDRFVHFDPVHAIIDNTRAAKPRQLTYGEYYSTYGTTEETDGWEQRKTPEGKVYYEKAAHECATHKR